jgi:2-polyprenyl-3-methyl-5-hydroxy-6-metoxy-1,4-benzoquinol methylase
MGRDRVVGVALAVLSAVARRKKLDYFFSRVPKDARILEVGCADGWVGRYAMAGGWSHYTGIDIVAPAAPPAHRFVHGDVKRWQAVGLAPSSYDVIIAFEVIEHGDFFAAMAALLRPGGLLMVTTPVPRMDWACQILEALGLNQRRSSPHTHLIRLRDLPAPFVPVRTSVKAGLSQWGIFSSTPVPAAHG